MFNIFLLVLVLKIAFNGIFVKIYVSYNPEFKFYIRTIDRQAKKFCIFINVYMYERR